MRGLNTRYDAGIDHLRAFAALLVVFYHGYDVMIARFEPLAGVKVDPVLTNPLYVFVREGHVGVGLFMALSGFLFTRITFGQRVSYPAFMLNRFLRIYPLMLTILALAVFLHPGKFNLENLAGSMLIFTRLPGLDQGPILDIAPWTSIFWTITPEFQFYIIFPLLLTILHRFSFKSLIALLLIALTVRTSVALFFMDLTNISYATIYGRIDQFLIGMIAAAWCRNGFTESRLAALLFPLAFLVMLGAMFGYHYLRYNVDQTWWRAVWPTIEGLFCTFVIVTYLPVARRLPGLFSAGLAAIGEASFSLYLLHQAVITYLQWPAGTAFLRSPLTMLSLGAPTISFSIVAFCLAPFAIAVSLVTYRVIERPFLNLRVRYLRGALEARPLSLHAIGSPPLQH
jgi:peptidoglycan/LPS O-acetylase OafA/YrhL